MNDVQDRDRRASVGEESLTSEGRRFDRYAANYSAAINGYRTMWITGESFEYFMERRLSIVEELLARSGKGVPASIVDFGCGAGDTQVCMRKRFRDARLVGIDASAESVRVARERSLPNVEFSVSDGLHLPLADDSIDVAYSNGTFHHIQHSDHPAIAREIYRVLRPGGSFFIFENNGLNPLVVWSMAHADLDEDARRVPHWKMRRNFANAGFHVEGVHFYAFFPKFLDLLRRREGAIRWLPLGAQYAVWGHKVG